MRLKRFEEGEDMAKQTGIKETYLRVPEELHKRLRHEAAEYDVSLNQCIITLLGEALEARHTSVPNP